MSSSFNALWEKLLILHSTSSKIRLATWTDSQTLRYTSYHRSYHLPLLTLTNISNSTFKITSSFVVRCVSFFKPTVFRVNNLTVYCQISEAKVFSNYLFIFIIDAKKVANFRFHSQAEFVVRFTGTPLPKVSWFKDGFEIFSSRRTRIITDSGRSVLLIHQTALNDEGEIKCTATNRAGHASTKSKLVLEGLQDDKLCFLSLRFLDILIFELSLPKPVERLIIVNCRWCFVRLAPPKIRLPRQYEDGLLFEQDETIRLKVSLAGRPSPMVYWYHNGESIPNDERHIFETMDGESVLKISDAKRIDRGEYTVKAMNKLGDDTSSFLVTVTGAIHRSVTIFSYLQYDV